MKRLLLLLAIVAGFMAGCSKSDNGGGSDNIILDEKKIKITLLGFFGVRQKLSLNGIRAAYIPSKVGTPNFYDAITLYNGFITW